MLQASAISKVWDWVSLSVFAVVCWPVLSFVINKQPVYAWFGAGMLITHIFSDSIKKLTHNVHSIFNRPIGAKDCDMFCRNGDCTGKAGFPSGHVAHAAFFVTFINLLHPHDTSLQIASILYVVLVAMSRHQKKCHNIQQVSAGAVLGISTAYIWYSIYTLLAKSFHSSIYKVVLYNAPIGSRCPYKKHTCAYLYLDGI